jgi:hypothetical protein
MNDERMKILENVQKDPNYGKAMDIIDSLDTFSRDYDSYEYGLPTGVNPDFDLDMVLIVLKILNA